MSVHLALITLNLRHADVRRDLANATGLHRRLMGLIPDDLGPSARQQAGLLYRLEADHRTPHVLVQAHVPLDLTRIPADYTTTPADQKDITRALTSLRAGQAIRYRIQANPTKATPRISPDGSPARGKRTGLDPQGQRQWWTRRATEAGLHLDHADGQPQFHITTMPDTTAWRPNGQAAARHSTRRFDGTATITDPDALRLAIITGIGPGKSHGHGLLSLAPRS